MQPWNTTRATAYGAAIGLAAAAVATEMIGATLAFALLCGLAAALRNLVQRRLTRSEFH